MTFRKLFVLLLSFIIHCNVYASGSDGPSSAFEPAVNLRYENINAQFDPVTKAIQPHISKKEISGVSDSPDTRTWHTDQTFKLNSIYQKIKDLKRREPNIATFRLTVTAEGKIGSIATFTPPSIFVSGFEEQILNELTEIYDKDLEDRSFVFHGHKFYSVANTLGEDPNKSYDYNLRKEIATFFELEDSQGDINKELELEFKKSLKGIKEAQPILDIYRSSLEYKHFTETSANLLRSRLRDYGYFIKKKGGIFPCHSVDEAFDHTFILNFSDSEQSIRFFIHNPGNLNKNWHLTREMLDFLAIPPVAWKDVPYREAWQDFTYLEAWQYVTYRDGEFNKRKEHTEKNSLYKEQKEVQVILKDVESDKKNCIKRIKTLEEIEKASQISNKKAIEDLKVNLAILEESIKIIKQKVEMIKYSLKFIEDSLKSEEDDIKKVSYNLINNLLENLTRNTEIKLDIASLKDMCQNCKATFLWDIIVKKLIQRSVWLALVNQAIQNVFPDSKDIRQYINKILNEYITTVEGKSIFDNATSCVSIEVSSLTNYKE